MSKSKILSLAALALGFGLVLTQSAFKPQKSISHEKRDKFTFHYEGPTPITKSTIVNASNWVYGSDECPSGDDVACSIQIEREFVDNPNTAPTLNSSAALESDPFLTAPVITGSADDSMAILNRQQ